MIRSGSPPAEVSPTDGRPRGACGTSWSFRPHPGPKRPHWATRLQKQSARYVNRGTQPGCRLFRPAGTSERLQPGWDSRRQAEARQPGCLEEAADVLAVDPEADD